MRDPTITEIMVNGPDNIFYEREGRLYKSDIHFKDDETLRTSDIMFFANQNRPLNEANPISDLRLPDGSRANAVFWTPIAALNDDNNKEIHRYITRYCQSHQAEFYRNEEGCEISEAHVSGTRRLFSLAEAQAAARPLFLTCLSSFIPKRRACHHNRRFWQNLTFRGIDNLVRMEARLPGPDGNGEVNIGQMIRTSLRMRPDRIIVGEVRKRERRYDACS